MKIYVASSWRNPWQPGVVAELRRLGQEVYDFREPTPGERGFSWSAIDQEWQAWDPWTYRRALSHPLAVHGFGLDMDALRSCDACVLVQPCGRSAHLELGWAAGAGKRTAVLFPGDIPITAIGGHSMRDTPCAACGDLDGCHLPAKRQMVEPELMVKCADVLIGSVELEEWVTRRRAA